MADNDDYAIHDVRVSDSPQFSPGGQLRMKKVVTYFIGSHGPFTNTYEQGDWSAALARQEMEHMVQDLRRLNGG